MPAVDIVDSTWFNTGSAYLAPHLADAANWRRWWPDLRLRATDLRGVEGVRWNVEGVTEGPGRGLTGRAEIWLEPADGGVVAHFFLRLDSAGGKVADKHLIGRIERRYRSLTKQAFWALGDRLDPGRLTRLTTVPAHVAASGTRARATPHR